MIHLRVVSPPDVTQTLVPALQADPTVMNLTVLASAASNPDGDALFFDVPQGAANQVIGRLRDSGVDQRGSIILENVDTSISALADRVSARRGRFQQYTPVWAEIESRIGLEGTFPPSWFTLLVIAGLIGAVGILTNSQILIVGAMVVGPEYGAILSLSFGVTRRDFSRVARSATALGIGFALAVAGALLLALIVRWAGLESTAYAAGVRPVSNLINTPNWFSFIVAALAGVVGVVSLTEARSSTLIGVFISVTTIPAASDIGYPRHSAVGAKRGGLLCNFSSMSPFSPPLPFWVSRPSERYGDGWSGELPRRSPASTLLRGRLDLRRFPHRRYRAARGVPDRLQAVRSARLAPVARQPAQPTDRRR